MFGQSHVDYAALRRCHRLKRYGLPIGNDSRRHAVGHGLQGACAPLLVPLHVNHNERMVTLHRVQEQVYQELQRSQGFASLADEQAGVLSLNVHGRAYLIIAGGLDCSHDRYAHSGDKVVDYLYRLPRQPFVLSESCDTDPGLFSPYAEYSGPAFPNDLYGDFPELGV